MIANVIGATGATGHNLVQGLIDHPEFEKVHVFVRRPLTLQHEKLIIHQIDFDKPETWQDKVIGDVAFSCLGTTLKDAGNKDAQWKVDYNYQYEFAKAAKANGISQFVLLSSYGANPKSRVFYSKMKGSLEESVKKLEFPTLTVFKPGILFREQSNRPGEHMTVQLLQFFNRFGLFKKHRPLPTKLLAEAMIKSCFQKDTRYNEIELYHIFEY